LGTGSENLEAATPGENCLKKTGLFSVNVFKYLTLFVVRVRRFQFQGHSGCKLKVHARFMNGPFRGLIHLPHVAKEGSVRWGCGGDFRNPGRWGGHSSGVSIYSALQAHDAWGKGIINREFEKLQGRAKRDRFVIPAGPIWGTKKTRVSTPKRA